MGRARGLRRLLPGLAALVAACGSSSGAGVTDGGASDGTLRDAAEKSDVLMLMSRKDTGATHPKVTCDAGCPKGLVCVEGACQPPQTSCKDDTTCEYDSYCRGGKCVPYGAGMKSDPACTISIAPGTFAPTVFCQYPAAVVDGGVPVADPFPAYVDVQATPERSSC